ncbi:hypothetical protein CR513_00867, partial [Mucuna pruriens]
MKHKFEVCEIFVDFFHFVKNQFDKFIKRLWSDNGPKFVNLEFSKFLKYNGVIHELKCVNTLQQNGVVKRKNRYLLKVAKAFLFQMFIPNIYWRETGLTATYLINKLPSHVLNSVSPIKYMLSFFPSSPLMLSLPSPVFGYIAFFHSHNPHCEKLDPKAIKCVLIGYPSNKKEFKCYHPPSRHVFVSMGESYLEVESIIESLPFPTQDVQVQEVIAEELITEKAHNELEVSILENPIGEVTDDMSEKGKKSYVNIIFINLCVLIIYLYNIKVLLQSLMQSKHLHQYKKL